MYDETRQQITLSADTFRKLVNLVSEMDLTYDELAEQIINSYADKATTLSHAVKIKSQLKDRHDRPDTLPMVEQSINLVCHAEAVEEEIKYLHENNYNDFDPAILSDALEVCESCISKLKPTVQEYL